MARNAIYTIGVVLLALGIIGFFSDPILGLFATNTAVNLTYIVSGILALVFGAMGESSARTFARTFGIIFGIILILGLITPDNTILGVLAVNTASNFLHFLLTAAFLYFGFAGVPVMRRAYAANDFEDNIDDLR